MVTIPQNICVRYNCRMAKVHMGCLLLPKHTTDGPPHGWYMPIIGWSSRARVVGCGGRRTTVLFLDTLLLTKQIDTGLELVWGLVNLQLGSI